jgi:multiple sugar transport system ATP-binding protein
MNFANVSVVNGEGGLWVETTGLKLRLPGALAARAAPFVGKPAVLGIRPEDLRVANGADPAECCMESEVEVVERLGSVTLLDTRVGSETVVAAVEPLVVARAHDKVRLAVTPERIHLFDAETEKAV